MTIADELEELTIERDGLIQRMRAVILAHTDCLSPRETVELYEVIAEQVTDFYYPWIDPAERALEDEEMSKAIRNQLSDRADYHGRVL